MLFQNVFELAAYPCRISVREDVGKCRAVCDLCRDMPEYLSFHLRLSAGASMTNAVCTASPP